MKFIRKPDKKKSGLTNLLAINWGGFYLGSGGSCLYASGSILQLNITGGLIIGIGD